jgi:hypothetical protein
VSVCWPMAKAISEWGQFFAAPESAAPLTGSQGLPPKRESASFAVRKKQREERKLAGSTTRTNTRPWLKPKSEFCALIRSA